MKSIQNIDFWKNKLGLFPVTLNYPENLGNYLMLNGGQGDFCFQTKDNKDDPNQYHSNSWSSNTRIFLTYLEDKICVYDWLNNSTEEIPHSLISNNVDKFYKYLQNKSYKSSNDIVPFVIDIFRQFRNLTLERSNPLEALNLLFRLLTSLEDDSANLNLKKWNLTDVNIPDGFNYYIDKLRQGLENTTPNLDLIIRHSAGAIFQEAQKEILFFDPQIDLFGGFSNNLVSKANLYSSIHYTPAYLSRTIVENSLAELNLNVSKIKIFDPACGSAEFLMEALKHLKEKNYLGKIEIEGWDSSETAIATSKFLLEYENRTIWKDQLKYKIKLVEDSLTEEWDNDYDLILMNPPFLSWELLKSKDQKEAVRNTLGVSFKGRPNQASAFLYKSITSIKAKSGVLGSVIPSSFLTLDSYSSLRNEIDEISSIRMIGKLGNFIFEDALTDVSFLIFKNEDIKSLPTILWTKNEKGIASDALRNLRRYNETKIPLKEVEDFSIYKPKIFPLLSENWRPISKKNSFFLNDIERFILEKRLVRSDEVFNIFLGIRQGIKGVFKIDEEQFCSLNKKEKLLFRPVVESQTIKNGIISTTNYIWYPYDANGMIFNTEEELSSGAPRFYSENLKPNQKELEKRASIQFWWGLTRPGNWQFKKKKKIFSAEFGKSNSFAFDEKGIYVVERGNAWIPKTEFEDEFYYFYLAIFSSTFYDSLLSIYSKQLAGGKWYALGRKHTKDIPIPNVNDEDVQNSDGFFKLIEIGKSISKGNRLLGETANEVVRKYFYP